MTCPLQRNFQNSVNRPKGLKNFKKFNKFRHLVIDNSNTSQPSYFRIFLFKNYELLTASLFIEFVIMGLKRTYDTEVNPHDFQ